MGRDKQKYGLPEKASMEEVDNILKCDKQDGIFRNPIVQKNRTRQQRNCLQHFNRDIRDKAAEEGADCNSLEFMADYLSQWRELELDLCTGLYEHKMVVSNGKGGTRALPPKKMVLAKDWNLVINDVYERYEGLQEYIMNNPPEMCSDLSGNESELEESEMEEEEMTKGPGASLVRDKQNTSGIGCMQNVSGKDKMMAGAAASQARDKQNTGAIGDKRSGCGTSTDNERVCKKPKCEIGLEVHSAGAACQSKDKKNYEVSGDRDMRSIPARTTVYHVELRKPSHDSGFEGHNNLQQFLQTFLNNVREFHDLQKVIFCMGGAWERENDQHNAEVSVGRQILAAELAMNRLQWIDMLNLKCEVWLDTTMFWVPKRARIMKGFFATHVQKDKNITIEKLVQIADMESELQEDRQGWIYEDFRNVKKIHFFCSNLDDQVKINWF